MITAIVTSLDQDNLLATPSNDVDVKSLIGKKARYVDKNGKIWPGMVSGSSDDLFVVVVFENFPSGLGQGQMLDILDSPEDRMED
jgi:hypothetical protein